MTPGTCSACGGEAERGPSGAWWHLGEPCSPMEVHIATVRGGLWGPLCEPVAWIVPLIQPESWEYATCLRCRQERRRFGSHDEMAPVRTPSGDPHA